MRDTIAVFRELIGRAESEILIASYAIHNGAEILKPIAERMAALPDLHVGLFLDVQRGRDDRTLPAQLLARYRQEFVTSHWPGDRLPALHYFKPSLESDWRARASMHAKMIVVDRCRTFITSANLTKAAQSKNIEIGTLIESEDIAARLCNYFEGLVAEGVFAPF
jgi:phosphatidylserine/phosphatidylglycerophosphate/cardiolipin synthase-like enzyme